MSLDGKFCYVQDLFLRKSSIGCEQQEFIKILVDLNQLHHEITHGCIMSLTNGMPHEPALQLKSMPG